MKIRSTRLMNNPDNPSGNSENRSKTHSKNGSRKDLCWQSANVRLASLDNLVKRRGSSVQLNLENEFRPVITSDNKKSQDSPSDNSNFTQEKTSPAINKLGLPHCLCERSPSLSVTDASKQLLLKLVVDTEEFIEDIHNNNLKRSNNASGRNFLSDGDERTKQLVQNIVKQLQSNSNKYLSRSANSVRFRVCDTTRKSHTSNNDDGNSSDLEEFPIPLGGIEMHPDLLLRLSCATIKLNRGKGLLRQLCLNQISLDLFVYMFWFIHCRFFQKHSGSEQRYLLGKISGIFPSLIELLTTLAPPHQRDNLLRHFPFVLSKAIHLGFRYLCPGNQSLFKGPFLCILNISVFRLLTGVDICHKSVDSFRLKLYPEDNIKDESGGEEDTDQKERKIDPLSGKELSLRRFDSLKRKRGRRPISTPTKPPKASTEIHNIDDPYNGDKNSSPRQHQVNFDVYQISPLLQQCLGRDSISLQSKRFIKRVKPIQSFTSPTSPDTPRKSDNTEKTYLEELTQQQFELKRNLMFAIDENEMKHRKARLMIARDKAEVLKSRESTRKMASAITERFVAKHQVCQKVLST